jgi:sulfate/thiosulfate transport system permease protein
MAISSSLRPQRDRNNPFKRFARLSIPWKVTWIYLIIMLFLPGAALILKAATLSPAQIWQVATSPVALSAYEVTFVTAAIAALINDDFYFPTFCGADGAARFTRNGT